MNSFADKKPANFVDVPGMPSPNSVSFRPLSTLKGMFVKPGRRPLRIAGGLFRGVTPEFDLQRHTQVYLGLCKTETFSVIEKSASDASWAVDAGAGAGELSIYFLRRPECRMIYAFEPQTAEVEMFRRNVLLIGFQSDQRLVIMEKVAGYAEDSKLPIDQLQIGVNRPEIPGGSNSEVDWSHDEQDNEQIQPCGPCPCGADGFGP